MERKLNQNYLISLAKQKMKKEGKYLGGKIPFGFKKNKNKLFLKKNKKEIHIIKQMKLLKDQGHTYRSIAKQISKITNKNFDSGWIFRVIKRSI
jgi:DNA invertase Pin-like site-specific DNA recombinase